MTRPHVGVSDLALLQFLEVEHGIPIDWLRASIRARLHEVEAVPEGMAQVTAGNLRLHVSGGTICGVSRRLPPTGEGDET